MQTALVWGGNPRKHWIRGLSLCGCLLLSGSVQAEGPERDETGVHSVRQTVSDRRVPTPRGGSMLRAQELGLGTRDAAEVALHRVLPQRWIPRGDRPTELFWPIERGRLGRGFGFVRSENEHIPHRGFDIAAPTGTPFRAVADGLVVYSDNGVQGFGNVLIVAHAGGLVSVYAHAARITVPAGYRVRRGERIGFVGSTGLSRGPHLHLEIRRDGRPIDPAEHFRSRPWLAARRAAEAQPLVRDESYLDATLRPE